MSDSSSNGESRTPETEPPIQVRIGDVIRMRSPARRFPLLVIRVEAPEPGLFSALALIDEEQHRYGVPGTEELGDVAEVIGHKSTDETVRIITRTITGGQLDPDVLARVREDIEAS